MIKDKNLKELKKISKILKKLEAKTKLKNAEWCNGSIKDSCSLGDSSILSSRNNKKLNLIK